MAVLIVPSMMLAGFLLSDSSADNGSVEADLASVKRISPVELKDLLDKGKGAVIVDVRPTVEYKKLHISDAITVPLELVESSLTILPPATNIVFY